MAKKLSTTRKGFAIGLAVVGIAGLSLASAAQLDLSGPGTLQAGVGTMVNADCQKTPITIAFETPTRTGATYKSAAISLKGISADCVGKQYKVAVLMAGDGFATGTSEMTGSVTAAMTTTTTGALPVSLAGLSIGTDSITKIALTIYS